MAINNSINNNKCKKELLMFEVSVMIKSENFVGAFSLLSKKPIFILIRCEKIFPLFFAFNLTPNFSVK